MALPESNSVYLEDVSNIHQEKYMTKWVDETPARFGSITNKLFKPAMAEVEGDGLNMQFKYARADNVRFGKDPLGAIASPKTFTPGIIKMRWNKTDLTAHDFNTVSASVQTNDIDLRAKKNGNIIDFCDELFRTINDQFDEKLAIHRHLPSNGRVALVNGTPKQNNILYYADATATASNANGLRVPVDAGSISSFPVGTQIDFIDPATGNVRAGNIFVTDNNVTDLSIGCLFVSGSGTIQTGNLDPMQSTGDLALVANNDIIVFSGEYNVGGMYSLGRWFERPAATGDSFFGKNRQDVLYRWLNTTATREGVTSAVVNKGMFNDLAIAMGFREEDGSNGLIWMTDPTMHQALRDLLGEDSFFQIPIGDSRADRFMNFGSVGLNYQHGQFGTVKIAPDPLCPANTIRVISTDTWRTYFYGWRGLEPFRREAGAHWYTLNESAPNAGKGKMWKADWYAAGMLDWCDKPWLNGQILNVTPN